MEPIRLPTICWWDLVSNPTIELLMLLSCYLHDGLLDLCFVLLLFVVCLLFLNLCCVFVVVFVSLTPCLVFLCSPLLSHVFFFL
jgi:hypothetical protein